jgi:hypothetical protein
MGPLNPCCWRCRSKTCRAIRPPRAAQPRRGLPAAEQSPGRPASADGWELLAETHRPTRATILRPPDRWHKQASAPEPLVGPRRTLDRPVGTSRTSPWRAGHAGSPSGRPLAPSCGRRTLAWTPSPPISSSCGHPAAAGRATDMADRSSVRSAGHLQSTVTAQPMGSGPGPDGSGQAADTSSTQRPTMCPASRPRPTMRPARPGPDRTGQDGNADAPFGNPAATSIGTVHRDACTCARCRNVRKPGPRPMSARSCPASTMDATIGQPFGHRLSGRSGRTPSTPPGTPWPTASDADREPTNGTEGVRTSSIATTTRRPAGTRRAPTCGAGVCGWATTVGSPMASLPARP